MKRIFCCLAVMSLLLAGCLKDEDFDNGSTGFNAPTPDRFVSILNPNEIAGMRTIGIFTTPAEETLQTFTVAITGPVLNKEVSVTLAITPALVDAYNTEHASTFEVLPAAAYEIPTTVSIPAGKEYVAVPLKLKKAALDPTKAYALGVQVSQASDPAIKFPAKSKQALIGIMVKNGYDGVYEMRAVTEHPTNAALAGPVGPVEVSLVTDGVTSVITATRHPWANGSGSGLPAGYNTIFTVDPNTQKVTVSDANGYGFANSPDYDSRYDPATKTIYAKWQYAGTGGNRVFTDTLKFLRHRD